MAEYKVHDEKLNKNRKLINAVKKAGIETYNPQGDWNGFGYDRLPLVARIKSVGEQRKFNKIKKEVLEYQETHRKPLKTEEEIITTWAKRLVRLYNSLVENADDEDDALPIEEKLTQEEAEDIAREKLYAHARELDELIDRDNERPSKERAKLISEKRRENPLRYIKDAGHAYAIVAASKRHRSGYDENLKFAHELEEEGKIEKGTARDVARRMYYGNFDYEEIL